MIVVHLMNLGKCVLTDWLGVLASSHVKTLLFLTTSWQDMIWSFMVWVLVFSVLNQTYLIMSSICHLWHWNLPLVLWSEVLETWTGNTLFLRPTHSTMIWKQKWEELSILTWQTCSGTSQIQTDEPAIPSSILTRNKSRKLTQKVSFQQ